jgi:hypothetical protein
MTSFAYLSTEDVLEIYSRYVGKGEVRPSALRQRSTGEGCVKTCCFVAPESSMTRGIRALDLLNPHARLSHPLGPR